MKLGYVLSSGGPFGVSHLGVLKRLEEDKIKPDVLAGSSAGAIISGLYASGMSVNEMIDLSLGNAVKDMFSDYTILGMTKNGFGAIKGEKMLNILQNKTQNKNFHDLKMPLGMNAVDASTSREIILKKGSVAEAMRASASIPMLFKPYFLNGKYLIDGSVANPLPIKIAHRLGADRVIGITFDRGIKNKKTKFSEDVSFKDIVELTLNKLDDNVLGSIKKFLSIPFVSKFLSTLFRYLNFDRNLIKQYFQMHNSNFKRMFKKPDILIKSDLTNTSTPEDFIKKAYDHTDGLMNEIGSKIEQYKTEDDRYKSKFN